MEYTILESLSCLRDRVVLPTYMSLFVPLSLCIIHTLVSDQECRFFGKFLAGTLSFLLDHNLIINFINVLIVEIPFSNLILVLVLASTGWEY